MTAAEGAGLSGPRTNLATALELLGKRPTPDYRNACKEAISAVESAAKLISGDRASKGIKEPLQKLAEKVPIHGALLAGFEKLYGYTSDDSGIRHGLLDESTVGLAEAQYMIVACSAFVHYLISKAGAVGLLKGA